jgi:hypothetical protein
LESKGDELQDFQRRLIITSQLAIEADDAGADLREDLHPGVGLAGIQQLLRHPRRPPGVSGGTSGEERALARGLRASL